MHRIKLVPSYDIVNEQGHNTSFTRHVRGSFRILNNNTGVLNPRRFRTKRTANLHIAKLVSWSNYRLTPTGMRVQKRHAANIMKRYYSGKLK